MLEESILQVERTEARMAEEKLAAKTEAQRKLAAAEKKAEELLQSAEETLKTERAAALASAEAEAEAEIAQRRKSARLASEELRHRAESKLDSAVALILAKEV